MKNHKINKYEKLEGIFEFSCTVELRRPSRPQQFIQQHRIKINQFLSLCYKTTRDAIFAMNANLKEGNDKETINLSLQSQTYFERERERVFKIFLFKNILN